MSQTPANPPLRTADFDYHLPQELIAQEPVAQRDMSRLLIVPRTDGPLRHAAFSDLLSLLNPGDRLVFNDTKVIPARLQCAREDGGDAEILFVEQLADGAWSAMVRPGRRLRAGARVHPLACPSCTLEVREVLADGNRVIALKDNQLFSSIDALMEAHGAPPLPPYVHRDATPSDRERYQTVYARERGAVAAPTAGLHFTPELIGRAGTQGIGVSFVTLHVGLGTFRPVKDEDPRDHVIHSERYILSPQTSEDIRRTKAAGGRIVAVGTTSVRVLEFCSGPDGLPEGGSSGTCNLYILPGFRFRVVDGIVTNFHLPKSTLLMLISAFAGRDRILAAYGEAVVQRYRFFSYGDAMCIL